MSGIRESIDDVLGNRRRQLPLVEREIARWEAIRGCLETLERALEDARQKSAQEDALEVIARVDLDATQLSKLASESMAMLAVARARLSRHTVNLGVSGRARNGKSTLLQSLAGLDDEQIPTGRGQPVTAVRSRIYHSAEDRSARITLHTQRSFCEFVLAPYFRLLELPAGPWSIEDFARADLTEMPAGLDDRRRDQLRPYLARLREMQESLDTYRKFLTGDMRSIELEELRAWVAYPAHDAGPAADRRYLAVREAVITCPFPTADVSSLGLVDLPGLGELAPDAQAHHLAGLENDVDFVIIVKWPLDNTAMWSQEDQSGLDLIGQARGAASMRDFMTVLVNTGRCEADNIAALDEHIRRQLNDGIDGRHYQVWHADVADRDAVSRDVMGAALAHLAEALPRMDRAVVGAALDTCAANRTSLATAAARTLETLRTISRPTPVEELIQRAGDLQDDIAGGLHLWIEELHRRAGESYEDTAFLERVGAIGEEVREWILDGFGQGREQWQANALRQMMRARASSKYATEALNDIRNEVFRRFGGVDDVLKQRREEFWSALVAALGARLVHLMDGTTAAERLQSLVRRLREAPDPCPHLAETVDVVLDVGLDYRTRLMPAMRRSLEILRSEVIDEETGDVSVVIAVPLTEEGAQQMFARLSELARQAVYETGRALEGEPQNLALALLAYAEQFEDGLIRSGASDAEFRRLVGIYRDELWPEDRTGPVTATARIQRVVGLLNSLADMLREQGTDKGDD